MEQKRKKNNFILLMEMIACAVHLRHSSHVQPWLVMLWKLELFLGQLSRASNWLPDPVPQLGQCYLALFMSGARSSNSELLYTFSMMSRFYSILPLELLFKVGKISIGLVQPKLPKLYILLFPFPSIFSCKGGTKNFHTGVLKTYFPPLLCMGG